MQFLWQNAQQPAKYYLTVAVFLMFRRFSKKFSNIITLNHWLSRKFNQKFCKYGTHTYFGIAIKHAHTWSNHWRTICVNVAKWSVNCSWFNNKKHISNSMHQVIWELNKKLSYRRETARQLPTWREGGVRPSSPLPLCPLWLYLCVWLNPKATT